MMTPMARASALDLSQERLEAAHGVVPHSSRRADALESSPADAVSGGHGSRPMIPLRLPVEPPDPSRPWRAHGPGVPRRDDHRLHARRAGPESSAARCTTASSFNDARVQVALSMMNRHGLIAGRDRTGKTKTLQLLAGAAVEGRRAGLRRRHQGRPDRASPRPGDATNPKVSRAASTSLGLDVRAVGPPGRVPVAVGQARRAGPGDGPLVRAAAARQGPRPQRDPDLDPRPGLQVLRRQRPAAARPARTSRRRSSSSSSDEGKPILADYGGMSSASVGVLLRSIVVLEQEGADVFFGEPEFDVDDLLRTTPDGAGDHLASSSCRDVMDQPRLFSTFMLWMLAQLYETLPEVGRPAEAQAVLLLRRGAPALRRRVRGAAWTRSSGPPG